MAASPGPAATRARRPSNNRARERTVRDTFVFSWSLAVNLGVSVIASQTIRKPSSLRASSTIALQQAAFASPFAADFRECAQASQAPAATTALRPNSKKLRMPMAFKICSLARSLTADLRACTTASQAPASTSAWRPCGRHYIGQFCSRRLICWHFRHRLRHLRAWAAASQAPKGC